MLSLIDAVDFLHDPLGPLNSCSNQGFRPRAWLGIKEIFGRLQMTRHQDSGDNREHSFAALVHERSVSYSLFVRLHNLRSRSKYAKRIPRPFRTGLAKGEKIQPWPNAANINVSPQANDVI